VSYGRTVACFAVICATIVAVHTASLAVVGKPSAVSVGFPWRFCRKLIASAALADSPDMSARHLLSGRQNEDPGLRMVAEVITSGFASGFSWGGHADGKRVCCALPRESPKMAGEPYGAARVGRSARRYRAARNEVTMPSIRPFVPFDERAASTAISQNFCKPAPARLISV
jgi:hypothetical protein